MALEVRRPYKSLWNKTRTLVSLGAMVEKPSSFPSSRGCLQSLAPGSFHLQTHILSPLLPMEAFDLTGPMQINHYKQPIPNVAGCIQYLIPLCYVVKHSLQRWIWGHQSSSVMWVSLAQPHVLKSVLMFTIHGFPHNRLTQASMQSTTHCSWGDGC